MSSQDTGEIRWEQACSEYSEVLSDERESLLQCIYVFVEGRSEEVILESMFNKLGLDLELLSVELVSMGGASNAKHAVRILRRTASKDRPILLILDADTAGIKAAAATDVKDDPLTKVMFLPCNRKGILN